MTSFQLRLMYSACALIVGGAIGWAGWTTKTLLDLKDIATSRPTHQDVKDMIFENSPYRRDEAVIKRNLSDIDAKLAHIDEKVDEIHDAVLLLKNNKVAGK